MGKALVFAAVVISFLLLGTYADWHTVKQHLDYRAFLLVTGYAGLLVLARFSPGRCLYRVLVLKEPERHYPTEVRRAVDFATFTGTRILFAGLIFTLAEIARVLAMGGDILDMSSALVTALNASLYALILYLVVNHTSAAAAPCLPRGCELA